jgi:hypothetical protein
VSNWNYVAIAYIAAWGALAAYAVTLARRVTQARHVADALREDMQNSVSATEHESVVCDTQPAP